MNIALKNAIEIYDIEYDEDKKPQIAFRTANNQSFKLVNFKSSKWFSQNITFSENTQKDKVKKFIGSVSLHPNHSNEIVISTNFYPETTKKLPNHKFQLFKGTKTKKGWKWQQLTFDPVFDHLYPVIVKGDKNVLFWVTGTSFSKDDIQTDIMMSDQF